ncbi:MAG: fimbrillin family protein [Bacteroides sp.]|nr:fimbrillin family protein [Bacteroides sp.]
MKRIIYIPFTVYILLFSACSGDLPEQQPEDARALQLNFKQEGEGEAAIVRASDALTTENENIKEIGLCITQGTGYEAYPGRTSTRYTFKTGGTGTALYEGDGSSSASTTFYLIGKDAHIQAFYPNSAVAQTNSGNVYTIPVTIPAAQTFTTGGGTPSCDAIDYLYGSGQNSVGDATPITTNAMQASPTTIYLHHALAKVMFTLQCDKDRSPNTEYDCVKSIEISASSGNPFLIEGSSGSAMQINNGELFGLQSIGTLTFTPATGATPIPIGNAGTPATVACGLVAPLSTTPTNDITLTITLGKNGETTHDRTYTATSTAFKQQWKAGYCYTYKLVLGNILSITQATVTWDKIDSETTVNTEEQGIGSAEKLWEFAKKWNNDTKNPRIISDYEEYGWAEKDKDGNETFKIKLVAPITITGTTDKDKWTPIGTETSPLTIPFDGQGWTINVDLTGIGTDAVTQQSIPGAYAGIIGYTTNDISNVKLMTSTSTGTTASSAIEFTEAVYAGILAGKVEGNVTNCTAELNGITLLQYNGSATSGLYFGGLVGSCTGNIINSAVYAKGTNELKLNFKKAPAGSCIGGLAGAVAGTVNNCYTRITELSNQDATNAPAAGSLVGNITGAGGSTTTTFADCHYIENTSGSAITVNNCTRRSEPDSGVSTQTDFTGLCAALNAVTQKQNWSTWTEEKTATIVNPDDAATVVSVFLFSYRGTPETK